MQQLMQLMTRSLERPYTAKNKIPELNYEYNPKKYNDLVEKIASTIANDHYDLIEEDHDYNDSNNKNVFADTSSLLEIVKSSVWDLPEEELAELVRLSHLYCNLPADKYLDDDFFIEKYENILNDCIDDIKYKVDEIGTKIFWETYED